MTKDPDKLFDDGGIMDLETIYLVFTIRRHFRNKGNVKAVQEFDRFLGSFLTEEQQKALDGNLVGCGKGVDDKMADEWLRCATEVNKALLIMLDPQRSESKPS